MATVRFKQIALNQQFLWKAKRWIKIKPVMKSCCKMKYNAKSAIDPSITKVFNPNEEVQTYDTV